ncbi:Oidioi.mRNA.OKI2018_I69.chr2.g6242.t1.cds [Oikopleura dioica]|uniref:Oidioi.mRNA.OKI2018_I69.chr2.g6242.t1.cds n=1 Tax=Oikopleura dioica TaxID=34765 RepID=A0ABN7T9C9_OIKDI|nr:Oidioi.mRNA.OKI2018_I69.chr2.g6242.t1.cds [Oikopleura dioica]
MFYELVPAYAKFQSFLQSGGEIFNDLSVIPWDCEEKARTFLAFDSKERFVGFGKAFHQLRPQGAQNLHLVGSNYFVIGVKIVPLDEEFMVIHEKSASFTALSHAVDTFIRFKWNAFAGEMSLKWSFPQLDLLNEGNLPQVQNSLSVEGFWKKFSSTRGKFTSLRIEIGGIADASLAQQASVKAQFKRRISRCLGPFQDLHQNGKLLCPAPANFSYNKADFPAETIKAWDKFLLTLKKAARASAYGETGRRWTGIQENFLLTSLAMWPEARHKIKATQKILQEELHLIGEDIGDAEAGIDEAVFVVASKQISWLSDMAKSQTEDAVAFLTSLIPGPRPDRLNELIKLEGVFRDLDSVLSSSLPRLEASKIPAVALLFEEDSAYPLVCTYKADCFSIINPNTKDACWLAVESGLTGTIGQIIEREDMEDRFFGFDLSERALIIKLVAKEKWPKEINWMTECSRKRRR